MSKNQIFMVLALVSLGVLGFGVFYPQLLNLYILLTMFFSALLILFIPKFKYKLFIITFLVILASLMRAWFIPQIPDFQDIDFWNTTNNSFKKTIIEGIICDEPDVRHTQTKYTLCADKIFNPEKKTQAANGKVLITTKRWPELAYGDRIKVTGLLQKPLVIDGFNFNITVIAAAIMAIFGKLNRRFGAIMAIFGIVLFIIFTGCSASAVRAGIMGGIAALAIFTGRQGHATTALILAALIMAWPQPLILWYDVGFQLSFLSTAGLIFISPFLEKYTSWIPNLLGLKEAFLLTISAQIAVVPLIAYHFGRISLISAITNLAVAPFIIFAMGAGFAAVLAGMISSGFGIFVSIPAYFTLNIILAVAHWGAKISWADITMQISMLVMIFYYVFIVFVFGWLLRKKIKN
ncbi:MAG: ComEC/Rec2 family competence protein [Patescibacteria group bacterium]|nr:ComEC/Rec2 family competence protein [Patescibacteria group bacterium]